MSNLTFILLIVLSSHTWIRASAPSEMHERPTLAGKLVLAELYCATAYTAGLWSEMGRNAQADQKLIESSVLLTQLTQENV